MHYKEVKSILSSKNGMNLYRGCTHGCIYCDSRSVCYNMDHDFEDVEIKENAIELLEKALKSKRKKSMIGMGSMTDPYMPLEKQQQSTKRALELVEKYGFGITLITKSDLILRDIDLLQSINKKTKCVVQMTVTTFDEELCKKIEPGVCTTKRRFEALRNLQTAGIPTIVWLTPILPFINDNEENISKIVELSSEVGVKGILCFGMGLTLREGNREYFYQMLDEKFPGLKEKYIRCYSNRYVVNSLNNDSLMALFHTKCQKNGIWHNNNKIFEYLYDFEEKKKFEQLCLWNF